jgi:glycerate 2-kinase
MPVLTAPASLKGVLSAQEAAAALAQGFRAVGVPADESPIADGGEGTADVLAAALGGEWSEAEVSDPLGRPVRARWLMLHDGTAVVESAEAIGLWRLAPDELDPLRATSRGLGELIQEAARHHPGSLLVCLGGSATVDGGEGVLEVLKSLPGKTTVLHDVRTTLRDAPRVYGPQKGATPEVIVELERRLTAMAELRPFADLPGGGAAGGLGAALAALGAELVPGATSVLARIGFEERARTAAFVVTGEGTVDSTTLEGKAPGEAARVCRELGVPCAMFGGRVAEPLAGVRMLRLSGRPERAREDLLALGGQLGRELAGGGL